MNGLPYYKAYPRDFFEGTVGMPVELKGIYRLVLDLIYMQGGALIDDPRYIAGHLGAAVKTWTTARAKLIEAGKLFEVDGTLRNNRADKERIITASFLDKQRINGREPKKNRHLPKAVAKPKVSHTEPEPEPESKGGGGSARVRETDTPTLRERIMDALGVDRSGLLGPNGKLLGTQAEMQDVARWSSELGLTEDEQIAVIRETMQGSRAGKGPPGSLRYFNAAMSRFAEAKARPLPAPATSSLTLVRGTRNDPRFDEAHREFARRVGAGEINRGPDPSDPFAGR